MKKIVLILIVVVFDTAIAIAQLNMAEFISTIQQEMPRLEVNQDKKIVKFMRYALKKYPELRSDSIKKVPVYSVCVYKKYVKECWSNDSLFAVLNPRSIRLNAVLAYNDGKELMWYIDSPYLNIRDQPVNSNWVSRKIFEIIRRVNPQFIFALYGERSILFTLKNNLLTFWELEPSEGYYRELSPIQFLESYEDPYELWGRCIDVPLPPVYTYGIE